MSCVALRSKFARAIERPDGQDRLSEETRAWLSRLQCLECGKSGGALVLCECVHNGGFVIHAKRKCFRHAPNGSKVIGVEDWEIAGWAQEREYLSAHEAEYRTRIGCDKCGIIPAIAPATQPDRLLPKVENMAEKIDDKMGFMSFVAARLKDESEHAGVRIAAKQFLKTAKTPIIGVLKRKRVDVAGLQKWLETPIGEGVFGILLGHVVPHMPGLGSKAVGEVLGKELRVAGQALIGGELADVLLEPLRQAMLAAFADELVEKK